MEEELILVDRCGDYVLFPDGEIVRFKSISTVIPNKYDLAALSIVLKGTGLAFDVSFASFEQANRARHELWFLLSKQ